MTAAVILRALEQARREGHRPVLIRVTPAPCWQKGGLWVGFEGVPVGHCTGRSNVLCEDGAIYWIEPERQRRQSA